MTWLDIETHGTVIYAHYAAACPECGELAQWLSWADQNKGARDTSLGLRVDCERCDLVNA